MDPQKSPEQIAQLQTWAAERDAVLLEISVNREENNRLLAIRKDLATSIGDIEVRIIQSVARMQELDQKEKDLVGLTNSELASLFADKSSLQSEVTGLKSDVKLLTVQKNSLIETISSLTEVHDRVYSRVGMLDKVVDNVVKITNKHLDDMNAFIKNLIK